MWSPDVFAEVIGFRARMLIDPMTQEQMVDPEVVDRFAKAKLASELTSMIRSSVGVAAFDADAVFKIEEEQLTATGRILKVIWCRWWPSTPQVELFGGPLDGLELTVPPPAPAHLDVPLELFILERPEEGRTPIGEKASYSARSWKPMERRLVYFADARVEVPA